MNFKQDVMRAITASLISIGSLSGAANAASLVVSGNPSDSAFSFSSTGGTITVTSGIVTWSSGTFLFDPSGVTEAPRIASYTMTGDFVAGQLGAGENGVYGALTTPFSITSTNGSSAVIGIIFDDDGSDDDFHFLIQEGDPAPAFTYTIPAFSTTVTFTQGTFSDLTPGTYSLTDGALGHTLDIVAVPEPSASLSLLGLLGAGLLYRRRAGA